MLVLSSIRTDEDWDHCASVMEEGFHPHPFLNAIYQRQVSQLTGQSGPVWMIHENGDDRFCTLWREHRRSGNLGLRSHLTTLDWSVIAIEPALIGGTPESALRQLVQRGPEIAAGTGIGLAALHKIDRQSAAELADALAAEGIPSKVTRFNTRWRLRLEEGAEAYLARRSRKTRYNIRRSERLLESAMGLPIQYDCFRSGISSESEMRAAVRILLILQQDAAADDPQLRGVLGAFFPAVIEDWCRRGWAEVLILRVGERPIAAQLCLCVGDESWVVLMEHDRHLDRFSPGILLLLRQINEAAVRGTRVIDLGGEGDSWKQPWATESEDTFSITWPLGGVAGLLWRARHRFTRGRA